MSSGASKTSRRCEVLLQTIFAGCLFVMTAPTASSQGAGSAGMGPPSGGTDSDLQRGISLTRQGRFTDAIPLLLAANSKGSGGYAAAFDLALCYVGVGRYAEAVADLEALQQHQFATPAVSNLLAQAYVGEHDQDKAWSAIEAAVRQAPTDERMYGYLLNACTDHYEYPLGLKVTTLGLRSLPRSARLHYERAVFLARLDRLDEAKPEFRVATTLDADGDIGYLASVQGLLYEDDLPHALEMARKAVRTGHRDYQMMSLLATVLVFMGTTPGQPQFAEAKSALETSVAERPDFSTSQIALGKLYLVEGRWAEAVTHLEIGRRLEPQNPAVYTSLASAYRRLGNTEASAECTKTLAKILNERRATDAPRQRQTPSQP